MTLKNLLKISGDPTRQHISGVLLDATHATAINGHVYARLLHNLDLSLGPDECVRLDATQVRQIEAVKRFHVMRVDQTLNMSGTPVAIQKRADCGFVAQSKLDQFEPKPKDPVSICFDPHLLADLQRALSESPRQKGLVLTFDLENPTGPMRVTVNDNAVGCFMPMRLDEKYRRVTQI